MVLLAWHTEAGAQGATALAKAGAAKAAEPITGLLECTHTGNCVNSLGDGGLAPLAHQGSASEARARLLAVLKTMSEAEITRQSELEVRTIFTTLMGFRDEVTFVIDPAGRRIDFRSRSLLGLYDFGKNRSRMEDFARRFESIKPTP